MGNNSIDLNRKILAETTSGQLFRKMFLARKVTIMAGIVLAGLYVFLLLIDPLRWDRDIGSAMEFLWETGSSILILVILIAALITCYYTYRVALLEVGFLYAAGHMLLCFALTPVFLTGPLLIPILVNNDIERRRQTERDCAVTNRQ